MSLEEFSHTQNQDEVQRNRIVAALSVFSLALHLFTYQAYKKALGDVGWLIGGMTLGGMLLSSAVLLMSLMSRPSFRTIRLSATGLAAAWNAVTLLQAAQAGRALQPAELLSVGILTALALALLPFGAAVALTGVAYLAVCAVSLLTGTADALTLLVLGVLLLAMALGSEYGEHIVRERARTEVLQWLASRDSLTGLLNRSAAEQELETWLQTPHAGGCLLLLDLDSFKQVNDCYGHSTGDRALQYTADVLRRLLGPGDLAGRWGGEEFVLLLNGRTAHTAREVTAQLRSELRRSPQAGLPPLTISGGSVCVWEAQAPALRPLMELADRRLYQAKAAGRDCFIWPPEQAPCHGPAPEQACCTAGP
ncbi:diguanylate cyclase (plasmid) [Deinococcus proteolyticus MRP]|uniref:Diguanylate cyclase n=1 Tax=Deinococcus proteolyticus (strain ATCC 35074 / DSM 20540 / JCM 6276 / NBRC 101906 / NCIMB 13154 / VKM Ac-1939 / CCM 2703 / MRP) TaxID=693977 RepID=F0RR28_DEIPM|nr:diguanylate cyclase [Deinococcus proteolyticus MRP]